MPLAWSLAHARVRYCPSLGGGLRSTVADELQVCVHNSAMYAAAVCRLLDRVCAPILRTLQERVERDREMLAKLTAHRDLLLSKSATTGGLARG